MVDEDHKYTWVTEISKRELQERGIDWRARWRSFGGREIENPRAAEIVDRALALGCVSKMSKGNLEHLGSWLYGDIDDTMNGRE